MLRYFRTTIRGSQVVSNQEYIAGPLNQLFRRVRYDGFVEEFETKSRKIYISDYKTDRVRGQKPVPGAWKYPKPYERKIHLDVYPAGVWRYVPPSGSYYTLFSREGNMSPQLGVPYAGPTGFSPESESRAMLQAQLALKGQKVSLGVAIAEAGKTASLVASTATRVARAFTAVRRGRLGEAANHLGVPLHVSSFKKRRRGRNGRLYKGVRGTDPWAKKYRADIDNWLELQYGWKPLLVDLHGAVQALAERDYHEHLITAKGVCRIPSNSSIYTEGEYPCLLETTGWEGTFVRLDACLRDEQLDRVRNLGLSNPLEIAWEVIPYSFIVDWFLPIGDAIQAMDYALGLTFLSGSVTHRLDATTVTSAGKFDEGFSGHWSGKSRRFHLRRDVLGSFPFPARPTIKNPVSYGHMANALSLLVSAFTPNARRLLRT